MIFRSFSFIAIALVLGCFGLIGCEGTPDNRSSVSPINEYVLAVAANPRSIPANGSASTILTITLQNLDGDLISGENVFVSTTRGTLQAISTGAGGNATLPAVAIVDGFGRVELVSANSPSTAVVTVSIQDIEASAVVTFL